MDALRRGTTVTAGLPGSPKLIDYVDQITALKAAITTADPDEIERKMTALNNSQS